MQVCKRVCTHPPTHPPSPFSVYSAAEPFPLPTKMSRLHTDVMDFMSVSSYGSGTTSKGSVVLKKDMNIDPKGKHILV